MASSSIIANIIKCGSSRITVLIMTISIEYTYIHLFTCLRGYDKFMLLLGLLLLRLSLLL